MKVFILIQRNVLATFDAEEVILPTITGLMGVLDNHMSFITALDSGVMLIREKSEWSSLAIIEGAAVIQKDYPFSEDTKKVIQVPPPDETCVVILVKEAEFAKNLDIETTQAEYIKAQALLASARTPKEKILAKEAYGRNRARYQVAQRGS